MPASRLSPRHATRSSLLPRLSWSGSRPCLHTTRSRKSAPRRAVTAWRSVSICATANRLSPSEASGIRGEPPHVVAARAAGAGVAAVIVIDLARVGTGTGLDLALIGRVREAVPGLTLLSRRRCSRGRRSRPPCRCRLRRRAGRHGAARRAAWRRRRRRGADAFSPAPDGRPPTGRSSPRLPSRSPSRLARPASRARARSRSVSICASISTVVFGIGSRAQSRRGNT